MEHFGIVRLPRIGNGKHNIHFDPIDSEYHHLLQHLATMSRFNHMLSRIGQKDCVLRETGISATRPMIQSVAGEGMEWHSDGAAGEYTVLLSLSTNSDDMGSLGIVPQSFLEYRPLLGHEQIDSNLMNSRCIRYSYEEKATVFLDARTLHSVAPNVSDRWRFIVWFIYDAY